MTLADIIIYADEQQLRKVIQQAADADLLNKLDEYGYTPLIQTLIANDEAKAKLILEQDVDVNLKDVTGRHGLHWCAEHNNLELARLLLERGADANAFNFAGEPVLVKPLLRQNKDFIRLMWEHGANSTFAHDYINAKAIGHQFELKGSVDIVSPNNIYTEIDYEGFYFEFSLELMAFHVKNYFNNYAARDVRAWLPRLQQIYHALCNANQLIKYDHYLTKAEQYRNEIQGYVNKDPLVIPVSQEAHAITLIRHKNLFAICDRANIEKDEGIIIYYMNRPTQVNFESVFQWIYQKQELKPFYKTLTTQLGLRAVASIPLRKQVIGNCSWANSEAIIPVLYYMMVMNDPENKLSAQAMETDAMDLYSRWREWTRERLLQQVIHNISDATKARKPVLAALLAGVLFQSCSADHPGHIERAKRIIPVLKAPGLEYILDSYIEFYLHRKPTEAGKNLQRLLDIYARDAF